MVWTGHRNAWGLAAAALMLAVLAGPGHAQSDDNRNSIGNESSAFERTPFYPTPPGADRDQYSDQTTGLIVQDLENAARTCGRSVEPEYAIDCLAAEYKRIAEKIPSGKYREAREVIEKAARDLHRLASLNADRSLPRARLTRREGGRTVRSEPLTPVRSDRLPDLGDAAAAIVQEAETVLLRSAEASDDRRLHYQRIAAAVGSGKVLLRSL